jgi:hypothetical protein
MNTIKTLLWLCILAIAPSWAFAQNSTPQAFAGKVTAVSENSITVTHRGQPKTLSVDASTAISDATNISEIQVGQIVGVRTDVTGTKALMIRAKWYHPTPVQPATTPAAPAE